MAVERLERLLNLVAALIDTTRPLTRDEIHSRVEGYSDEPETFRRNFERDKDLLRRMGLPLVVEALDPAHPEQVGYRIPRKDYELVDPGLDEDELSALRLAASAAPSESAAATSALRKLGGAPHPAGPMTQGPAAEIPTDDAVATAFGALGERRRLRFRYRGEERLVDPWRLSFRRGQWYLAGLDHSRGGERLFRLDRVEGPLVPDGPKNSFARPEGRATVPPPPWRLGDEEEVIAKVLIDAEQVPWALSELGIDALVERLDNGSAVFELAVTSRAGFRSFVLGFLDHAEVLEPPEARQDLVSWLEGIEAGRV